MPSRDSWARISAVYILVVNARHEGAEDKTHLLGRFGDEGVAVLDTEVGPRFTCQEAELTVARLTGRVRDAPQRVGHLHPLKQKIHNLFIILQ